MSIFNFSQRKLQTTPADSFEKAKAFQIGMVDKSGKNVKTADGWKPIRTHSHLIDKKYSAGSIGASRPGTGATSFGAGAKTVKNEKMGDAVKKIGESGKMPSDGDLKMLAAKHGVQFSKFKEACETSIRAHENEKEERTEKDTVRTAYNLIKLNPNEITSLTKQLAESLGCTIGEAINKLAKHEDQKSDPWVFNEKEFDKKDDKTIQFDYDNARKVYDASKGDDKEKVGKFMDKLKDYMAKKADIKLHVSENDRITGIADWDNPKTVKDLKMSGWDLDENDIKDIKAGKTVRLYSPNGRRALNIKLHEDKKQ